MFEISIDQFEEIMQELGGRSVWVELDACVMIPVLYEDFEFSRFEDKVQLGHREYDEYKDYQNIWIDLKDIVLILRDDIVPYFGSEEIVIELVDGNKLYVRMDA